MWLESRLASGVRVERPRGEGSLVQCPCGSIDIPESSAGAVVFDELPNSDRAQGHESGEYSDKAIPPSQQGYRKDREREKHSRYREDRVIELGLWAESSPRLLVSIRDGVLSPVRRRI